jgi:hypothetical protein
MNPSDREIKEALGKIVPMRVPEGFADATTARFQRVMRVRLGMHLFIGIISTVVLAGMSTWWMGANFLAHPAALTNAVVFFISKAAVFLSTSITLFAISSNLATIVAIGSALLMTMCITLFALLAKKSNQVQWDGLLSRNHREG